MSQGMTRPFSRTVRGGVSAMLLQVCALQVPANLATPRVGPLATEGADTWAEAEGFEPSMGF